MSAEDDRRARLAAALRANLRRRKGAARQPPLRDLADTEPPPAKLPSDS